MIYLIPKVVFFVFTANRIVVTAVINFVMYVKFWLTKEATIRASVMFHRMLRATTDVSLDDFWYPSFWYSKLFISYVFSQSVLGWLPLMEIRTLRPFFIPCCILRYISLPYQVVSIFISYIYIYITYREKNNRLFKSTNTPLLFRGFINFKSNYKQKYR